MSDDPELVHDIASVLREAEGPLTVRQIVNRLRKVGWELEKSHVNSVLYGRETRCQFRQHDVLRGVPLWSLEQAIPRKPSKRPRQTATSSASESSRGPAKPIAKSGTRSPRGASSKATSTAERTALETSVRMTPPDGVVCRVSKLTTSEDGESGTFRFAHAVSQRGRAYFNVIWHGRSASFEQLVPLFDSEVPWFVESTKAISERLDPRRFQQPGRYPILSRWTASGGPFWEVEVTENGDRNLLLGRFDTSLRRSADESFYTRYFVPARRGRYRQQVRLPESFLEEGGFTRFSSSLSSNFDDACREFWDLLSDEGVPVDDLDPRSLFDRVLCENKMISLTTESLSACEVISRSILLAALELCGDSLSVHELARRLSIEAKELSRILAWTTRYDPRVIAAGYVFLPRFDGNEARFVAIRDKGVYRRDPLLTSLDVEFHPPPDDESVEWVSAPQCTTRSFERALEIGDAFACFVTPWGRAPYCDEDAGAIRLFFSPPKSHRKYCYRLLQILWRLLAEALNLPGGREGDPVLQFQCLSILWHDASVCFGTEPETAEILTRVRERMRNLLDGVSRTAPVNEWDDLPRRDSLE